jgi:hypothetical protein
MTLKRLAKILDKTDTNWDAVQPRRSQRADLHAFLLIDELCPTKRNMVAAVEHDQIWLGVEPEALAVVISEAQAVELGQCGVFYDEEYDSLGMFA